MNNSTKRILYYEFFGGRFKYEYGTEIALHDKTDGKIYSYRKLGFFGRILKLLFFWKKYGNQGARLILRDFWLPDFPGYLK